MARVIPICVVWLCQSLPLQVWFNPVLSSFITFHFSGLSDIFKDFTYEKDFTIVISGTFSLYT